MEWIDEVARLHDKWLQIAEVYGAADFAEDCVQNAYIKLHKYAKPEQVIKKDGEVNDGYVFFVVKSCVMEYHKKKECFQELIDDYLEPPKSNEADVQDLWMHIDAYTSGHYPLYKRILYKMWRGNYTIREMVELTEVSGPTIVNELKKIKKDIKTKFTDEYNETQKEK